MYRSRDIEMISPTFTGYIATSKDALVVIQNALVGRFPLVKRRPKEKERPNLIRSGNIFVFIEETSGIKRWTDGMSWSPSRILGRFLIYRELDRDPANTKGDSRYNAAALHDSNPSSSIMNSSKSIVSKGPNGSSQPATAVDLAGGEDLLPTSVLNKKRKMGKPYADDYSSASSPGYSLTGISPSASAPGGSRYPISRNAEFDNRSPSSSASANSTSYVYKEQGLIKKSLSIVLYDDPSNFANKKTIHVVSYYTSADVLNDVLDRPASMDQYRNTPLSFEMLNALRKTSIGSTLTTARRNSEIEGHFQGFIEMDGFDSNFNEEFLKMLEERQKAHPELFATQEYSKRTVISSPNRMGYLPTTGAPNVGGYVYLQQQQQAMNWNNYDYSTAAANTNANGSAAAAAYPQYQMAPIMNSSVVQMQQQQQQQVQQPYAAYPTTTGSYQQQPPQYVTSSTSEYQQPARASTTSDPQKTSPASSSSATYARVASKSLPYSTSNPSTQANGTSSSYATPATYAYGYQTHPQQQQHYQGYMGTTIPHMASTNSQQGQIQQPPPPPPSQQQIYGYSSGGIYGASASSGNGSSSPLNQQQAQAHQR